MSKKLRPRGKASTRLIPMLVVLLALPLTACTSMGSPVATAASQYAPVQRGRLISSISAVGSIRARANVTPAFETPGRVSQVLVVEGQQVAAGDVLAQLDDTDLVLQVRSVEAALAVAQAQLAQLKEGPQAARVDAAEGQVAAAQASLGQAEAQRDELLAGGTEAQITAARSALQSARANYDQVVAGPSASDLALAQAALDKAAAAVAQAQAAYDRVKDQPNVGALPESLALQRATIDLQQAQASYDALANPPTAAARSAAASQISQAEAQLAQLQAGIEPQRRRAQAAVAAAQAQLDIAQAQLNVLLAGASPGEVAAAEARVEQAQVAVDSARLAQDRAILKSPLAGVVAYVGIETGEYASPQVPAMTLLGENQFTIEAEVDETDIGWIALGQEVQITLDAFPGQVLTGKVIAVAPQASEDLGVVSYRVTVDTGTTELPLRAGMTATTEIVREQREDALLVPNVAITVDPETGIKLVMRKTGSSMEEVEIITGLTTDIYSEVLAGLTEGDQVVVAGAGSSRDQLRNMMGDSLMGGGGN